VEEEKKQEAPERFSFWPVKNKKKKDGRPRIYFVNGLSAETLQKVIMAGCTQTQAAIIFGCSERTINRFCKDNFGDSYDALVVPYQEVRKRILEIRMFEKAMSGDTMMMIWLSKQWLGMSDKVDALAQVKGEVVFKTSWGTQQIEQDREDNTIVLPASGAAQIDYSSKPE
jgi:hypothetical protein